MTKQDLLNIQSIFGSEKEFRNHLSALILDNAKRVECRPATGKEDKLFQTCIFDWDKEWIVAITNIGRQNIETVIITFDCIQNVILRYNNFEEATKFIPSINNIDPIIKENLQDDAISWNTEGF